MPGGKPKYEHPWIRGKDPKTLPNPCVVGPPRWLEMNREAIFAMAAKLNRSPEAAHYLVIQLLHANYGKVMTISRKRRTFKVPLAGYPDQDFFTAGNTIFNRRGDVIAPLAPETLSKLLLMMQDYIFRLRLLNRKYKWYGNGDDHGNILCLLGEQDELVRLMKDLFGGSSDIVSVTDLLKALNELDFQDLFTRKKTKASPWLVRDISDLYSEVTAPDESSPSTSMFDGDSKQLLDPKLPFTYSDRGNPSKEFRSRLYRNMKNSKESSTRTSMTPKQLRTGNYLASEIPQLFFAPFDSRNSATWMSRHPDTFRLDPTGKILKRRVKHYRTSDENKKFKAMADTMSVHSEKSYKSADFQDMFGADVSSRRSTRNTRSSIRKRKSSVTLSGRNSFVRKS